MRYSSVLAEAALPNDQPVIDSCPTHALKTDFVKEAVPSMRCRSNSGTLSDCPTPRSGTPSTYAGSFGNWADVDPSNASLGDWDPSESAWAMSQDTEVEAEMGVTLSSESNLTECPGADASTESSALAKLSPQEGDVSKRGWWRLVWCHERCHKEDCEAQRQLLSKHAEALGGSLVCLKKAAKFQLWLRRTARPPYILITDWREAKPCRGFLAGLPERSMPALMVVLCEVQSHFERAAEWAGSLPVSTDQSKVQVCQHLDIASFFYAGLAQLTATSQQITELPVSDLSKADVEVCQAAIGAEAKLESGSAFSQPAGTLGESLPPQCLQLPGSMEKKSHQDGLLPGMLLLKQVPVWPMPQMQVLSANQVERLLKEAMPQYYED